MWAILEKNHPTSFVSINDTHRDLNFLTLLMLVRFWIMTVSKVVNRESRLAWLLGHGRPQGRAKEGP